CLRQSPGEALASQHEDEAMLLDGLDDELDPVDLDRTQPVAELDAELGGDAAGAPVGDPPVGVHGAEVAPCRPVPPLEMEVGAEGLEQGPAHWMLQRIVAEEPEVARSAPRGDAGTDMAEETAGR